MPLLFWTCKQAILAGLDVDKRSGLFGGLALSSQSELKSLLTKNPFVFGYVNMLCIYFYVLTNIINIIWYFYKKLLVVLYGYIDRGQLSFYVFLQPICIFFHFESFLIIFGWLIKASLES